LIYIASTNKMQSDMADFAPGDATWQTPPNNIVWRPTGATTWWTGWKL